MNLRAFPFLDHEVFDHYANPMRLTESNKKVVELHPLSIDLFSSGFPSLEGVVNGTRIIVEGDTDGNFLEIFVL